MVLANGSKVPKTCTRICGIYRLQFPEDTCQCDSACAAANDCCKDFNKLCPDVAKNPDERETRCLGFSYPEFKVGLQMVTGCPRGSASSIKSKCHEAKKNRNRANLLSDDILLHIPVTTKDFITYANVFCALCNGEWDFEYWDVDLRNLSECFIKHLESSEKQFDPISWRENVNNSLCQVEGDVRPTATRELKSWLYSYIGSSSSRFSKYCFNDDLYLSCGQMDQRNASANKYDIQLDSNACPNAENRIYQVCFSEKEILSSYIDCPCNAVALKRPEVLCHLTEFEILSFHLTFIPFGFGVWDSLYLKLFFTGPGVSSLEYTTRTNIFENVTLNCTDPCQIPHFSEKECDERNANWIMSKTCFYPYPLMNQCLKVPCDVREKGQCEDITKYEKNPRCEVQNTDDWKLSFTSFMLFLSILSLSITILLIHFVPGLRTNFSYYQINCYLMQLVSSIFLIISAAVMSMKTFCILSAVILHFSLLSSFTWMMVTGGYILGRFHSLNCQVGNAAVIITSSSMIQRYLLPHMLGHLLPAIFILLCFAWDSHIQPGFISYGQGLICWIGQVEGILRLFVIPAGLILFVNVLMFICCAIFLLNFRLQNNTFPRHSYMLFALTKLLIGTGAQWLLGIMAYFYPENRVMQYGFVILVSTHGILTFLCTLLQRVVRRETALVASAAKANIFSVVRRICP